MKNEKSYTEIMKARTMHKMKNEVESMLDVYIQMILDEALYKRKRDLLEQKINEAIDTRNKTLFMSLSKEYQELAKFAQ
ncbi:IDEAL domain-containing protein [Cytobacillus sp. S13-E01]|uniref:IDEAL domain-containing protein n=1 Tax=Cytobacillus sp. S13-E01 TaxID=3031326 RepID=UPI0023D80188|nr:IDEAL domain-containing protein [Cytobacillus sp. S13-E01]MDF0726948.1 IDEAL domain-containing protein [Cytobacillus sp. S13-E01]